MVVNLKSWSAWVSGEETKSIPELSFLPSRMKRRMSQLSRMIVEIGHRLISEEEVNDIIFASRYGELNRQLKITEGILDDGEVSPAAFSQSVFNTPVALVSLLEKITGITRAVYAGPDSFQMGLLQAVILAASPGMGNILYLFGDENIPKTYEELVDEPKMPMALGMILSSETISGYSPVAKIELVSGLPYEEYGQNRSAGQFLEWLGQEDSELIHFGTSGCCFSVSNGTK